MEEKSAFKPNCRSSHANKAAASAFDQQVPRLSGEQAAVLKPNSVSGWMFLGGGVTQSD